MILTMKLPSKNGILCFLLLVMDTGEVRGICVGGGKDSGLNKWTSVCVCRCCECVCRVVLVD